MFATKLLIAALAFAGSQAARIEGSAVDDFGQLHVELLFKDQISICGGVIGFKR